MSDRLLDVMQSEDRMTPPFFLLRPRIDPLKENQLGLRSLFI
jgi:hypothetical protein